MMVTGFSKPAGALAYDEGLTHSRLALFRPEPRAVVSRAEQLKGVIHVVDQDGEALQGMRGWLAAAGLGLRVYSSCDDFLDTPHGEAPGCLVIDIQQAEFGVQDLGGLLRQLARRYPVIAAGEVDVPKAVRIMKAGAYDFVEKPYCASDMIGLLQAAVALDGAWRLAEARHGALRARFDALSRRERQVMALVTTGLLNKQVAGHLGVSEITVKAHRGAMMRKMGAGTLAELVRMADSIGDDCRACGLV